MKINKAKAKLLMKKMDKARHNYVSEKAAEKVLRSIKKETGFILDRKTKLNIDDYAKSVLGSKAYAPWLYVYTSFNQKFIEGWIPDNYFGYIVAPKLNKNIGEIANIKTLSKKIIDTDLLPDLIYIIHGKFYDTSFKIIDTKEAKEIIFNDNEEIFLKKDDSNQGKGVYKLNKETFDSLNLNLVGDAVIQKKINQMKWFDEIIDDNVATIRITTVNHNGIAKKKAAYLRLGRKKSDSVKSEEALAVPIIDDSGLLSDFALGPRWNRYFAHPDTDFKFAGNIIPNYKNIVKECEEIHKKLPHFQIIGWDAIISEEGEVKLMEWNARHPGIIFTEATIGPSFKEYNWEQLWKD